METIQPTYMKKIGSREEVWQQIARQTPGGLQKKDLMYKKGKIVSKRASLAQKKRIAEGKGFCKMCFEKFGKNPELLEEKQNIEIKEEILNDEYVEKLRKEYQKSYDEWGSILNRTGKESAKTKKLENETEKKYVKYIKGLTDLMAKKKKEKKKKEKKKKEKQKKSK